MIKTFFNYIWVEAQEKNIKNIIDLLERKPNAKVLDIGCGDGHLTIKFAKKIGTKNITGVDGVKEKILIAKKRGIKTATFNLEDKWPFQDNQFDVLVSNQVIEHILDLDNFISEARRILKLGGYFVVSTENLSSWHNIFALSLGLQDFSHHLIKKSHVGNPLSLHVNEKTCSWSGEKNSGIDETSFPHIKIPTFISLRKIFEVYQFKYIGGKGSGYYPLFKHLSFLVSKIDPYHSHFISIKVKKITN